MLVNRDEVDVNPSGARRALAGFGSLVFLLLAPGFVAGLVPFWISRWRLQSALLGFAAFRAAGALLVVAGLAVLLESFWRFAVKGLGTPAPTVPTRRLVVSGLYRHVSQSHVSRGDGNHRRTGAALRQRSPARVRRLRLVPVPRLRALYEEPTLTAAYPAEYPAFRANVPRWIPRRLPWRRNGGNAETLRQVDSGVALGGLDHID